MNQFDRTRLLRAYLADFGAIAVPGIHDGLSARLVQKSGFKLAFVSGAGVAMSRLGQADLALLSFTEICDSVRAMALACDLPLIVDIDTGFGNAHNAALAVRQLERAGASGCQIEDQTFPKRCGHLTGKQVISVNDMSVKIRAIVSARTNKDTLVIARTDALAITGLTDALLRCDAYLEAGADALFVEAPRSIEEMKAIASHVNGRAPLVHNFVEGGKSPIAGLDQLESIGYKLGLFPLIGLHAGVPAQLRLLQHLQATGQTANWSGPMADLHELNKQVYLSSLLEQADDYR
jgi:2-methylisocitrate lyase-like PEP mutase family enzyme